MDIFLCPSRKTVNESEIPFIDSLCRDTEIFLRPVRHIVFRILCRIVVLVSIYPENGKVSRMARPHPVVGVSSEFTYR